MTDANDFERDAHFSALFKESADKVVLRSRRSTMKEYQSLASTCSKLGLNPDSERSKFIKRRKLYRKQNDCDLRVEDSILSVFSPKIYVSRFQGGVAKVGYIHNGQPEPPPPNFGERSTLGLTKRARRRIADGVNALTLNKTRLSFITLSYSDDALPCHTIAKKQLSSFLKCLTRYVDKVKPAVGFKYVWVAEIQPKRLKRSGVSAIHFHICTPHFIPADLIRRHWRRITKCDKALPNVILVNKPIHYMSKYLAKSSSIDEGEFIYYQDENDTTQKRANPDFHWIGGDRYGMDHATSKACKPIDVLMVDGDYFDFLKLQSELLNQHSNIYASDYSASFRCPSSVPLSTLFNSTLRKRIVAVHSALETRARSILGIKD